MHGTHLSVQYDAVGNAYRVCLFTRIKQLEINAEILNIFKNIQK